VGENADRVRRAIELFNEGKIAEVMDLYADNAEVENWGSVIGGTYRGKREIGEWFQKIGNVFPTGVRLDVENLVEHGNQVIVEWNATGTLSNGKMTGTKAANVITFEGPKVSRQRYYTDTETLARDLGRI
jgi:ketosteroid isomerase-like protein